MNPPFSLWAHPLPGRQILVKLFGQILRWQVAEVGTQGIAHFSRNPTAIGAAHEVPGTAHGVQDQPGLPSDCHEKTMEKAGISCFFYRILPLKTMENGDECDDQLEN